jgi:hypothetical protein
MFTIKNDGYQNKLVLPRTMAACPSDNDGVHLNSEPFIKAASSRRSLRSVIERR